MNSTLEFIGLDIEQEMMYRFIFIMTMELEPDQLFEGVEIGQDFSDSGGKNCAVVMTKRCISMMREKSVFIKIDSVMTLLKNTWVSWLIMRCRLKEK